MIGLVALEDDRRLPLNEAPQVISLHMVVKRRRSLMVSNSATRRPQHILGARGMGNA
jgi:hypothetical protein